MPEGAQCIEDNPLARGGNQDKNDQPRSGEPGGHGDAESGLSGRSRVEPSNVLPGITGKLQVSAGQPEDQREQDPETRAR